MDQSDAGSAGIFTRWTNQTQAAPWSRRGPRCILPPPTLFAGPSPPARTPPAPAWRYRLPIANRQVSVVNRRPPIANRQVSVVNRRPPIANRQVGV
eukprot:1193407-Prorocentrum_minimum.AAC.4